MNLITYIIFGILIVAILIIFVISKTQNKDKIKKAKEDLAYMTDKICQSKQYLKYKNQVSIQSIIFMSSAVFAALTLILLILLPVFQIKFEFLGETIATKNFSFFDNYNEVKSNYNEKNNQFTDISSTNILIALLIMVAIAILTIAYSYFKEYKPFDIEERAKKAFIQAKSGNYKYFDREFIFSAIVLDIAIFITIIITCKNAEFNLKSDIPFTVTEMDNYLYYNFDDSSLSCKVFLNNFKFCNGVSGYIVLPIICFVVAVILSIIWIYLRRQLKNKIKAEIIEGLEENVNT